MMENLVIVFRTDSLHISVASPVWSTTQLNLHHVDTWKSTKHIPHFFHQTLWLLSISLLVLCSYYLRVAFISWKPRDINDSWIRYVQVRRWRLLDTVGSILSAVGTTCTTLALAWWSSSEIIHTCLLAAATIQGGAYFVQELQTVQLLFEGGYYLKKYGTRSSEKFTSTYKNFSNTVLGKQQ